MNVGDYVQVMTVNDIVIVGKKKLLISAEKKSPSAALVSLAMKVGLSGRPLFYYILTMAEQIGHELLLVVSYQEVLMVLLL